MTTVHNIIKLAIPCIHKFEFFMDLAMLMKDVVMVSPAISMQTMGQCWAHAIFCVASETPGTLAPKPRGNGSMRMKNSPWGNRGCIQKRGLTQSDKSTSGFFSPSVSPPIFLPLDWSSSMKFWMIRPEYADIKKKCPQFFSVCSHCRPCAVIGWTHTDRPTDSLKHVSAAGLM